MRVILDECLPRRLMRDIRDHSVTTVPRQGWAGIKNGDLLALVEDSFDVFVTLDRNLLHQQNLACRRICIVVLNAESSRYETLAPLITDLNEAINQAEQGKIIRLGLFR